jgi:hypothetical protein
MNCRKSEPNTLYTPPHKKDLHETGGYVGYYTRRWLKPVFDIVDVDGTWPALWIYRKAQTRVVRMLEEKPFGQLLHESQSRILSALAVRGIECWVVWDAQKLADEDIDSAFPMRMLRVMANDADSYEVNVSRDQFDVWLCEGASSSLPAGPPMYECEGCMRGIFFSKPTLCYWCRKQKDGAA